MNNARMKRLIKTGAWLLLASAVLSALLIGAAVQWAAPFDAATIHIDGEQLMLTELQAGHGLLGIGAALLALIVVLLVVPFVVVVSLLGAALGIVVALCSVLGVTALLLAPILLLAWAVWRLVRGPSPATRPGATMSA